MYQCSHCRGVMAYPADVCPHCGVLLKGVRCQGCGYTAAKSVFIANNHRCPKCGGAVRVHGPATPRVHTPIDADFSMFFRRLGAYLIDSLIITILVLPVGLTFKQLTKSGAYFPATLGLLLIYCIIMESSPLRATVGKLAMHLKVTDEKGQRVSVWRATARNAGKVLSTFILFGGFLMVPFTEKKQALHDKLANCLVSH